MFLSSPFLISSDCTSLLTVIEKYQIFVLRINEITFPDFLQLRKNCLFSLVYDHAIASPASLHLHKF